MLALDELFVIIYKTLLYHLYFPTVSFYWLGTERCQYVMGDPLGCHLFFLVLHYESDPRYHAVHANFIFKKLYQCRENDIRVSMEGKRMFENVTEAKRV